jgi:hypothetical protein
VSRTGRTRWSSNPRIDPHGCGAGKEIKGKKHHILVTDNVFASRQKADSNIVAGEHKEAALHHHRDGADLAGFDRAADERLIVWSASALADPCRVRRFPTRMPSSRRRHLALEHKGRSRARSFRSHGWQTETVVGTDPMLAADIRRLRTSPCSFEPRTITPTRLGLTFWDDGQSRFWGVEPCVCNRFHKRRKTLPSANGGLTER